MNANYKQQSNMFWKKKEKEILWCGCEYTKPVAGFPDFFTHRRVEGEDKKGDYSKFFCERNKTTKKIYYKKVK